jgi:hypothetical protein
MSIYYPLKKKLQKYGFENAALTAKHVSDRGFTGMIFFINTPGEISYFTDIETLKDIPKMKQMRALDVIGINLDTLSKENLNPCLY